MAQPHWERERHKVKVKFPFIEEKTREILCLWWATQDYVSTFLEVEGSKTFSIK